MVSFGGSGKGAFQLSLGFIIGVVFAIILLSLAIIWIQGLIGNITGLTTDLTNQAHTSIVETFENTNEDFAIWPPEYKMPAGSTLKMAAGIKNDAPDGQAHSFVINVLSEEVPAGVNKNFVNNWIKFIKSPKTIAIGRHDEIPITFEIPNNAIKGVYLFRVVSCYDQDFSGNPVALGPTSYQTCQSTSTNMWGPAAQDFVLTVE
jgi:uncharacterized protein YbdZ (MbtH family)